MQAMHRLRKLLQQPMQQQRHNLQQQQLVMHIVVQCELAVRQQQQEQ